MMNASHALPLDGLRVLDFGTAWAGPHASEALAFLGADVVKVESRQRLDLFRTWQGLETTPGFNEINLNKRSLALDLRHPRSHEVAERLVAVADVMLDNFRPGVMERLGLGFERVSTINPRLVAASISAFGSTGEENGYAGYAAIFCAMGGLAELTGYSDWEPALVRSPMDLTVANAAATLVTAALIEREHTGRGRFLDISATEVVSTLIPIALTQVQRGDPLITRRGNEGFGAFQGCYPCLGDDKWIALSLDDDAAVQAVGEAIRCDLEDGLVPDAIRSTVENPHPGDLFSRLACLLNRRAEANGVLLAWTSWQEPWLLSEFLTARGVAAHPTSSPESETVEEHLWMRGALATVHHPVQGELVVLHAPWRTASDGNRRPALRPGPLFGAHTSEVLAEWIQMRDDEFRALEHAGVFT